MSKPFKTTISEGIAELVFDHPPVNAFDSAGWAAIAAEIEALGGERRRQRHHHRGRRARLLRGRRHQGARGAIAT